MHSHASEKQEFHQKSRKGAIQVGQMGTQLYGRLESWSGEDKDNMSETDVVWVVWLMSCLR